MFLVSWCLELLVSWFAGAVRPLRINVSALKVVFSVAFHVLISLAACACFRSNSPPVRPGPGGCLSGSVAQAAGPIVSSESADSEAPHVPSFFFRFLPPRFPPGPSFARDCALLCATFGCPCHGASEARSAPPEPPTRGRVLEGLGTIVLMP